MTMRHIQCDGAESPSGQARADGAVQSADQDARYAYHEQPPQEYESPVVMILGSVFDLTSGSASSGNADANSQYYW